MAKVLVYNKEKKIERHMGEDQFKNWGSKNGFELVPKGTKPKPKKEEGTGSASTSKVNSGGDSGDSGDNTGDNKVNEPKKLVSVADIVTEIQNISKDEALSDEEKIEKINTFKKDETRSGVLKAIVKFGKQKTEKDA